VIVDIDQHSQEVLGKWPFSRSHFARMLDVLREDGAKVAAFDVTFSKADQSAAPIRALWAEVESRKNRGEQVDPVLSAEVRKLAAAYDPDKQFAAAIQRFGAVVLGNFFLHTEADLRGIDDKTLDAYANQIAFYSFPSVRPVRPGTGKQDRINVFDGILQCVSRRRRRGAARESSHSLLPLQRLQRLGPLPVGGCAGRAVLFSTA